LWILNFLNLSEFFFGNSDFFLIQLSPGVSKAKPDLLWQILNTNIGLKKTGFSIGEHCE
jgi:hypothetical protein